MISLGYQILRVYRYNKHWALISGENEAGLRNTHFDPETSSVNIIT
jgi:hypothetical protein